eukprot:8224660-Pyramimonas_sp.AAC.1
MTTHAAIAQKPAATSSSTSSDTTCAACGSARLPVRLNCGWKTFTAAIASVPRRDSSPAKCS